MAIGFERQQKSLIGANLPQARLDISAPDLSGLQRLGNTMVNVAADKAQRKKAKAESEAEANREFDEAIRASQDGADFAQSWIGVDENGRSVEFTVPPGSLSYRRAWLQAAENTLEAKFRNSVSAEFDRIQQEFVGGNITAGEAAARMQSNLDGQLENTPASRRGMYAEVGRAELLQRTGLMGTQEASRKEQALAADQVSIIKDRREKAAAHASAGGDASPFYAEIDKAYDALIGLNRMGKEEAESGKKNVRQLVTGQALVNRLTVAMAKGEVDPLAIDRFGTAIETNDSSTEIVVNKAYQVGPNARSSVPHGYRSKDVFTKIEDEALRKDMGQKLRQAATDWNQKARTMAEQNQLRDQLLFQDSKGGSTTPLPSALHDDADFMISNILATAKPFDTPEGRRVLLSTLETSRYASKPLIKQLVAMASSQDDAQVQKAIQMWQEITTLQTRHGVSAGDLIWRDTVEEDRNFLDSLRDAYSLQYPVRDIVNNMREARGSRNFTLEQLITDYNGVVGEGRSFDKDFRERWLTDFGTAFGDQQAQDSFAKAYRQSMILLRDPEKAFNDAYDRMKKVYQRSDIFVSGVAKTGSAELTNPYGYETRKNIFGNPAEGTEYDWLEDYIAADVSLAMGANRLILPEDMTPDQMNQIFRRGGAKTVPTEMGPVQMPSGNNPDFLGTRMKLLPVPGSNPDAPEYALRLFDEQGNDMGYLQKAGPDGTVQTFTINPHIQRAQETATAVRIEKRTALETAAKASLDRLMVDTVRDLNIEGDPRAYEKMPFEEYLFRVDPELEKQYRLDRMQIEDGLKKAIEQLEQVPGTPIPTSKVSPQSLLVPRAAGFDVAAAAATAIDGVLPDGTAGTFLLRIAAQESAFGTAGGTYRMVGDKGIMQTNTYSSVKEVRRQIAWGRGRVYEANEKLKRELGLDLAAVTNEDLDKPLVSMAMARVYFEAIGTPVPADVEGQAAWWKRHYNTRLGKGTTAQFLRSSRKVPDNWRDRYAKKD